MLIEFTGRQTDVSPRLRALAERKLKKLSRTLRGITHAHVILTADKHRQIAEITVQCRRRRLVLSAQEESADLAGSLGTALDRLTRQALRQVGKRRERKRESDVPAVGERRA
jgi:putative sigma-54 modulation protein